MGCTSSAPNTISANANTADKGIQIEEENKEKISTEVEAADIEDENRTNETKVLPSCDTFEEPVQIVKNNKSTDSFKHENDVPANGHVSISEYINMTPEKPHDEVNVTKMEMLVDKVFEMNHHLSNETNHNENESDISPAHLGNEEIENTEKSEAQDTTIPSESNDSPEMEVENDAEEMDEPEEASPSQSQSSRATRWEALADIAAELPPSLSVDPLTGQIYALSK